MAGRTRKGGEMGQIWEWVLEDLPSSSQRVGRRGDTESCDTHRFLLLFGWVQRLPRGGGRREGRAPRQGQRARKEPGQEREGERADEER